MTWMQRARRDGIAAAAAVLALACGGDDGPSGNTGSIQVAVTPSALPVQQGGSGSVTASLTRGGGFSGTVTLAITGLPAGVTTTITPPQLAGTTVSATVNVTIGATVAPGAYTATITATAQGVGQATTTYQLTVTAAADYALTVTPAALTIPAGGNGGATVNINRTNFTEGVALALLNPPAGITGVFTPTPSTTNESALAVSVAASVAPGAYPLTIQGTATGPGVKTTTLTVTVTAPPTGGTTVEYQFCDASAIPVFFAYQDGNGGWQAVTGSASGGATRFAFTLTQGRGGVLIAYRASSPTVADALTVARISNVQRMAPRSWRSRGDVRARFDVAARRTAAPARSFLADVYQTEILYASTTELAQDSAGSCANTSPTKTVTATVAGVPAGAFGIVSFGHSTEVFIGGTSTNPVTFTVPAGPLDLVGSRMAPPGTPPDKVVVFRNLDIPDGGSLPSPIDFNGPASTAPATATVTITGASGDNLETFVDLVTANSRVGLWFDLAPSPATTRPWAGLATAAMATGDYHGLIVFASPANGADDFRVSLKYVGPVANQTLALGPTISAPATSQVAAGAYPRFRFQGTLPAEYNKGASIDVLSSQDAGNAFTIIATSAWLTASGNALAYDLTMPDVAGLAGFPAAARLTAGTNNVAASGFAFTGPGIFDLEPNPGSEFKAASRSATITVP